MLALKYLPTTIKRWKREEVELKPTALEVNLSDVATRIQRFIRTYVENAGVKGVVCGMSGGIDSNTIAALSALAIGGENVLGLMLPEKETYNPKDIEDAKTVADIFGIQTQICDITAPLEGFYESIPIFDPKEKLSKGNIKARTRMIYLYYHANKLNRLVCGSSDKSETMMGYFTKWGDAAADIAPILDLYKTQVRKLAVHIGIPSDLAEKPSTPALWRNQSAEGELGIKYEVLDLVLFGLERFMASKEIAEQVGLEESQVEKIKKRWLAVEHKRRLPLSPKLEYRTVGTDFRLPHSIY
ncbi:MAG: NAD+ synthase [Candidatus Bathyarchaeota archaeon]|nr:NAD+ synthase [Candidatus Bathyarchaeota archaeon]